MAIPKVSKAHLNELMKRLTEKNPVQTPMNMVQQPLPAPQVPGAAGQMGGMPMGMDMGGQMPMGMPQEIPPGMGLPAPAAPGQALPAMGVPGNGPDPVAVQLWEQLQGSIGGQLWDRVHENSPMSSTMYNDPQTAFIDQMSQMLQGAGKRDPDIEEFFQLLLEQQDQQMVPGYGPADEADMEAINALMGEG